MAKQIDFKAIKDMSPEQQQQAYYTLAKRANQRFRDIGKTGETSFAVKVAQSYLNDVFKRDTFIQSKKLTGNKLKQGLNALEAFYTSKSSTTRGIRAIKKQRLEAFSAKDILIKNEKQFFDFLSSNQFKQLSSYADSNQVVKDYLQSVEEKMSPEQIIKQYDEFLNSELTFEQVAEKRKEGKILK